MTAFGSVTLDKNFTKLRLNEPKLSFGLNRKMFGLMPKGVYAGFHLKPSPNAREIVVYSDTRINCDIEDQFDAKPSKGWSVAVVEVFGGYNVTVNLPRGPVGEIKLAYDNTLDGNMAYVILRGEYNINATNSYLEIVAEQDIEKKIQDEQVDFVIVGYFNAPANGRKLSQNDIGYFDVPHPRTLPYANEEEFGFMSPEHLRRLNSIEDSALVYQFNGNMSFGANQSFPNRISWDAPIDMIFASRPNVQIPVGNIDLANNEIAYAEIPKNASTGVLLKKISASGYRPDDGGVQDVAPEDVFLPLDLTPYNRVKDLKTDGTMTEVIVTGGGNNLKNAVQSAGNNTRIIVNDSLAYTGEIDIDGLEKVVIMGASGERPVIDGGLANSRYGFKVKGICIDVLIQNFDIKDTVPSPTEFHTQSGITIGNGEGDINDDIEWIVIQDVELYNTGRQCITASKSGTALDAGGKAGVYPVRNLLIQDCVIRDLSYLTVTPTNVYEVGLFLRKVKDSVVYNTVLKDIHGRLSMLEDCQNLEFRGCIFQNTIAGESSTLEAMVIESEDLADWDTNNIRIINTTMKECEQGITIDSDNGYIDLFVNHSVFDALDTAIDLEKQTPLKIRNSAFVNNATQAVNLQGNSADFDYNIYFGNTVDLTDNAQKGNNAIEADPLFNNPISNDYSIPTNSPAYRAGSDDFDIGLFDILGFSCDDETVAFRKIIFFRSGLDIYTEVLPEGKIIVWEDNRVSSSTDTLIQRTQSLSNFAGEQIIDRNIGMHSNIIAPVVFFEEDGLIPGQGRIRLLEAVWITDATRNIQHQLPAGDLTGVADGHYVYYEAPQRSSGPQLVSLVSGPVVPNADGTRDYFLFGFRRGSRFILASGNVLEPNIAYPLFGDNAPEVVFLHKDGVRDTGTPERYLFPFTLPASFSSVAVFVGSAKMNYEEHYTVSNTIDGFFIEFIEEPEVDAVVRVYYPVYAYRASDAIIIDGGASGTTTRFQEVVINSQMIADKRLTLQFTPLSPVDISASIAGRGSLNYNEHYYLDGKQVKWDGKLLDNNLKVGQTIVFIYNESP